jgi:Negative regulator of sigma F
MQANPKDSDLDRRLEAWASSQPATSVSPELQQKLRDALRPSLAPVKRLPSRTRLVLAFVAVFLAGGAGLAAMISKVGLHLMTGVQIGATAVILAGCGTLFAVKLAGQMIPGARQVVSLWAVLILCGVGTFLGFAALFPWHASGDFAAEGWPCAVMEIEFGVPAAALFWLLARRGAPFVSAGFGATVAGAAVALALIPLQSQCMFQQAPHLLVWHGGTALLLIGLGAVAGKARRAR